MQVNEQLTSSSTDIAELTESLSAMESSMAALKETSQAAAGDALQQISQLEAQITELIAKVQELESELEITIADREWYAESFSKSQSELVAALAGRHPKQAVRALYPPLACLKISLPELGG